MQSRTEFIQRTLIVLGLGLGAVLLGTVLLRAADVLLVLFGGVLLGILLRGLADLLTVHTPLRERAAVMFVIAVWLALLLGLGALFGAEAARQFDDLSASLTKGWNALYRTLQAEPWGRYLLAASKQSPIEGASAGAFGTTLGGLANLAIVLFVGIYLAVNPHWYRRGLLRLVPPRRRQAASEILAELGHTLRWWLFGRAVGMAIVGVITAVGLSLFDVPLALGLGLLAAALDFVPYVGPIIAAAPAIAIAAGEAPMLAVYVAAFYLGVQVLEGYVITPLIEQRSVHLPPALTISAQLLLGVLVGVVGVVLASPLVAVLVVIIRRLYVHEALEHRP